MTPLIWFAAAWGLGIVLTQAAFFPPIGWLLLIPIALVLRFGWGHRSLCRPLPWIVAGLLFGAGRMLLTLPVIDQHHLATYNGTAPVLIEGLVTGEPDHRLRALLLHVQAEQITLPDGTIQQVHGQLLVRTSPYATATYGDRIQIAGSLETPPTELDFSYRENLAHQGIYSLISEAVITVTASYQGNPVLEQLYRFKAHALQTLQKLLPEPQASLLIGILLGVETGIPQDLQDAFSATGTSHIVAISGFNLAIVAQLFAALAARGVGKQRAFWPAVAGVWLYTLLVGASAAVVRAAIMGTVGLAARQSDRPSHGPTTLAAAALLMSILNPWILWDTGFQLSIAATAGLIGFSDPLIQGTEKLLIRHLGPERGHRLTGWLSDALLVTLAAQITTLPILLARFQQLSLITLLTNFLVLPVQPFVMLWGGMTLGAGLIWPPLGEIFGWIAWAFLTYTIRIVEWTGSIPWAVVPVGKIAVPLVWSWYALLVGFLFWRNLPPAERQLHWKTLRTLPAWQLTALAALGLLAFAGAAALPDGTLQVDILDVGQGDAILIRTPAGRQILIDGGPDPSLLLPHLSRRMPFWDRRLDLVVLTAPRSDRLRGLIPLLERYQVDFIAVSPEKGEGEPYKRWEELLSQRPPGTTGPLYAGQSWELDRGLTLQTLWPEEGPQAGPLVLQLQYGTFTLLLPGSTTTEEENNLVNGQGENLRSRVLLLARHGARTTSLPPFIQKVAPEAVIVSCGDQGAPPETLARFFKLPLYRTDLQGNVTIRSDGRTYEIRPERRP